MAHISSVVGGISELTAERALLRIGWKVARSTIPEVFDLVGKDPVNGAWYTFQVKTLRIRDDRGGALVVYTSNSKGQPYDTEEVDYFLAVDGNRVFMFENTGQKEYWSTEASASKRWIEITAQVNENNEVDNPKEAV